MCRPPPPSVHMEVWGWDVEFFAVEGVDGARELVDVAPAFSFTGEPAAAQVSLAIDEKFQVGWDRWFSRRTLGAQTAAQQGIGGRRLCRTVQHNRKGQREMTERFVSRLATLQRDRQDFQATLPHSRVELVQLEQAATRVRKTEQHQQHQLTATVVFEIPCDL